MNTPADSGNDSLIDAALVRSLHRGAAVTGSITIPAVPAMLEEYVGLCIETFTAFGVQFDDEQRDNLRKILDSELNQAFTSSPRSEILITYDSPVGRSVNYHVSARWSSVESAYDHWVSTREPPFFGKEADARVIAASQEVADPSECPVLDIGAGTGRNALALARRGHPVDALEMSGGFAELLREQARKETLSIRVIQQEITAARELLPRDYRLIVVSEVASDFRSTDELRALFEIAAECLLPGGHLVMNLFLPEGDYVPDESARQRGLQAYSAIFTREELAVATAGLELECCDETEVLSYEKKHLPPESWPPTKWYEGWVSGLDVFSFETKIPPTSAPISLRWLVYRKTSTLTSASTDGIPNER